jgi:serine/threonine-protein kinase RsbW
MNELPEAVRLTLPSRAENVAVVRHALAGLAEAMGMEAGPIADLKTIVTEACMNVVVHAYDAGEGRLDVAATPDDSKLVVVVRDYGQGIRPRPAVGEPSLRLGIPLIAALASSFEIRGAPDRGTEVRMEMHMNGPREPVALAEEDVPEATMIAVDAGSLAAPVISRVISILAARANLSVDRLSDAILLGDAISSHGPDDFPGGRVPIQIDEAEGTITVRIGPLQEGAAERLLKAMDLPAVGASLSKLADDVRVEQQGDDAEALVLEISQAGPRSA